MTAGVVFHTWALTEWAYEVAELLELSSTELSVLLALIQFADRHDRSCWPSQRALAKKARHKSTYTVTKALRSLDDRGVISRRRRHKGGKRTSDVTVLNAPLEVATMTQGELAAYDHDGDAPAAADPFTTVYEERLSQPQETRGSTSIVGEEPLQREPVSCGSGKEEVIPPHLQSVAKGSTSRNEVGLDELPSLDQIRQMREAIDGAKAARSLNGTRASTEKALLDRCDELVANGEAEWVA